jgi:hypothetical protein
MINSKSVLRCEKCGSTHFFEVKVQRYQVLPSAEPGGLQLSAEDSRAYVVRCLCGHVRQSSSVRTLPGPERQSFLASLEAALRWREATEPERIAADLSKTYVTRPELREFVEVVNNIGAGVKASLGDRPTATPGP